LADVVRALFQYQDLDAKMIDVSRETIQYYVMLHQTTPGAAYTHEAILKRGRGGGAFEVMCYGYGNCPDAALRDLHLEHWAVDVDNITFVREV
jgi:hypothetical protein